jgi:hypothetical protein
MSSHFYVRKNKILNQIEAIPFLVETLNWLIYSLESKESTLDFLFDSTLMSLGLLSNLVEKNMSNRKKVAEVIVSYKREGKISCLTFLCKAFLSITEKIKSFSEEEVGDKMNDGTAEELQEYLVLAGMCIHGYCDSYS